MQNGCNALREVTRLKHLLCTVVAMCFLPNAISLAYEFVTIPRIDAQGRIGISADGRTVVGSGFQLPSASIPVALAWTRETGAVELGEPVSGFGSEAVDLSQNGDIVVGDAGTRAGYRWSTTTGFESIPLASEGPFSHGT